MSEFLQVELSKLEGAFKTHAEQVNKALERAAAQERELGRIDAEVKAELAKILDTQKAISDKISALEQKAAQMSRDDAGQFITGDDVPTIAHQLVKSEELAHFRRTGSKSMRIEIKSNLTREEGLVERKAVINATGQNQPLVPAMRVPGIIAPQQRALRIRDLLPAGITSSNLIEFAKEASFTNAAAPQFSGGAVENVAKAESNLTFSLENKPVITLAHWIAASKQVLDDASMLQSYIEGRMLYGLRLEEEKQLLLGSGTNGSLQGILYPGNFTQFSPATVGGLAGNDTFLDGIRKAKLQLALTDFQAQNVVVNPADWDRVEGEKDTQGRYIYGDPSRQLAPTIWGLPVTASNTIPAGTALIADFQAHCQVWDRQQMAMQISTEHSDFFIKNMVALLIEERLALTVYRPGACIKLDFDTISAA
jgi:HK97 family phage major capsid protein